MGDKLTLSLGLRFEYYPLMTRADDSGIERLDYSTYNVLLGGRGTTPRTSASACKAFYFAPRLGAIYRLNDNTVLRAGYGRTINPLPWSRPMRGSYPLRHRLQQRPAEQYGCLGTLEQGIPPVAVPDLSSGAVPLPPGRPSCARPTRQRRSRDRCTRRTWPSSSACRSTSRSSVAYVVRPHRRRLRRPQPQLRRARRRATPAAQFFALAGTARHPGLGPDAPRRYHALQVAVNRPFKNGLLLKGAYTLSKAKNETDDDGWASLPWNHP